MGKLGNHWRKHRCSGNQDVVALGTDKLAVPLNWREKTGLCLSPNARETRLLVCLRFWDKDESNTLTCVLIGPLQPVQLGTELTIC